MKYLKTYKLFENTDNESYYLYWKEYTDRWQHIHYLPDPKTQDGTSINDSESYIQDIIRGNISNLMIDHEIKSKYNIQKEMIEEDIQMLFKLKERGLLHSDLEKEYAEDLNANDLGLMYNENLNESATKELIVGGVYKDLSESGKKYEKNRCYIYLGKDNHNFEFVKITQFSVWISGIKNPNGYEMISTVEEYFPQYAENISKVIEALRDPFNDKRRFPRLSIYELCDDMLDRLKEYVDADDLGLMYQESNYYTPEGKGDHLIDFRRIWMSDENKFPVELIMGNVYSDNDIDYLFLGFLRNRFLFIVIYRNNGSVSYTKMQSFYTNIIEIDTIENYLLKHADFIKPIIEILKSDLHAGKQTKKLFNDMVNRIESDPDVISSLDASDLGLLYTESTDNEKKYVVIGTWIEKDGIEACDVLGGDCKSPLNLEEARKCKREMSVIVWTENMTHHESILTVKQYQQKCIDEDINHLFGFYKDGTLDPDLQQKYEGDLDANNLGLFYNESYDNNIKIENYEENGIILNPGYVYREYSDYKSGDYGLYLGYSYDAIVMIYFNDRYGDLDSCELYIYNTDKDNTFDKNIEISIEDYLLENPVNINSLIKELKRDDDYYEDYHNLPEIKSNMLKRLENNPTIKEFMNASDLGLFYNENKTEKKAKGLKPGYVYLEISGEKSYLMYFAGKERYEMFISFDPGDMKYDWIDENECDNWFKGDVEIKIEDFLKDKPDLTIELLDKLNHVIIEKDNTLKKLSTTPEFIEGKRNIINRLENDPDIKPFLDASDLGLFYNEK